MTIHDRLAARRDAESAEHFLTVKEFRELVGYGRMTIYRDIHSGVLPARRVRRAGGGGGNEFEYQISESAAAEFLRRHATKRRHEAACRNEFGRHLRGIRKAMKLSTKDLTLVCGCNRSKWSAYETGKAVPGPKTVYRLASGLGLSDSERLALYDLAAEASKR